jgi:hypothetical protein
VPSRIKAYNFSRCIPSARIVSAKSSRAISELSRTAAIDPTNVAAVDVDHGVEVVIGPFLRALQFRDVPGPHAIRSGRTSRARPDDRRVDHKEERDVGGA